MASVGVPASWVPSPTPPPASQRVTRQKEFVASQKTLAVESLAFALRNALQVLIWVI